jgi:hypothetical protein
MAHGPKACQGIRQCDGTTIRASDVTKLLLAKLVLASKLVETILLAHDQLQEPPHAAPDVTASIQDRIPQSSQAMDAEIWCLHHKPRRRLTAVDLCGRSQVDASCIDKFEDTLLLNPNACRSMDKLVGASLKLHAVRLGGCIQVIQICIATFKSID